MKAKDTIDKDAYIGKKILKNFLELVSKHLSCVKGNTIFIEIDELCDAFGIKIRGDYEQEFWKLGHMIKKINIKNLGVKASEAISGLDPTKETSTPIDTIKNCDPDLIGIIFEVDIDKFLKIKNGSESESKNPQTINFDSNKSALHINEQQIKIKKLSDQYHVLRIIFENKKELFGEWFFSEIAEKYDREADFKDKKFYNAVYQLNKNIAIATRINKFFTTTNQSFQIDPKYNNNP